MGMDAAGWHVSERFARLLALYRKPDGSEWGGRDLERATGGAVSRSYVSNLKKGRIGDPGLSKPEAIAGTMGFPPAMWFGAGAEEESDPPVPAPAAAPEDEALGAILEEARKMGARERRLLLGIAREISPAPAAGPENGGGPR